MSQRGTTYEEEMHHRHLLLAELVHLHSQRWDDIVRYVNQRKLLGQLFFTESENEPITQRARLREAYSSLFHKYGIKGSPSTAKVVDTVKKVVMMNLNESVNHIEDVMIELRKLAENVNFNKAEHAEELAKLATEEDIVKYLVEKIPEYKDVLTGLSIPPSPPPPRMGDRRGSMVTDLKIRIPLSLLGDKKKDTETSSSTQPSSDHVIKIENSMSPVLGVVSQAKVPAADSKMQEASTPAEEEIRTNFKDLMDRMTSAIAPIEISGLTSELEYFEKNLDPISYSKILIVLEAVSSRKKLTEEQLQFARSLKVLDELPRAFLGGDGSSGSSGSNGTKSAEEAKAAEEQPIPPPSPENMQSKKISSPPGPLEPKDPPAVAMDVDSATHSSNKPDIPLEAPEEEVSPEDKESAGELGNDAVLDEEIPKEEEESTEKASLDRKTGSDAAEEAGKPTPPEDDKSSKKSDQEAADGDARTSPRLKRLRRKHVVAATPAKTTPRKRKMNPMGDIRKIFKRTELGRITQKRRKKM